MQSVVIWGATGHAKVLREFIEPMGYRVIGTFDNDSTVPAPFPDVPLYYGQAGFQRWRSERREEEVCCLVAIGGARGKDRVEIQTYLESQNLKPITAIHPAAYVARDATLGTGCQVLAHATVGAQARLGQACIVNTAASVDHECSLGAGVHIAPGATLAGCVTIGDFSLIAVGAVVLPRVRIGQSSIIGAGAVVTEDIPDHKVAYGNPAKVVRDNC